MLQLEKLHAELHDSHEKMKQQAKNLDDELLHLTDETASNFSECQAEMIRHRSSQREIFGGMELLDERFKTMGTMAVRIGDRLDALTKRRQRAAAAKKLLKYFEYFNTSCGETSDSLFTDSDRLHEAAEIIQQLQGIAGGLNAPDTEEAIHHIEKESQRIKVQLLDEFAKAAGSSQKNPDVLRMKQLASTILQYDGSENLHSFYVANVMQTQFANRVKQHQVTPNLEDQSQLFNHIKTVCLHEQAVMIEVFPAPSVQGVYKLLLERLFIDPAFGIQAQLEAWLSPAKATTSASLEAQTAYLDLVCSTYRQSVNLVEDLLQPISDDNSNQQGHKHVLVTREFLEGQVTDLFVSYKNSYPQLEKAWLQQHCEQIIAKSNFQGILTEGDTSSSASESRTSGFEDLLDAVLKDDPASLMFEYSKQAIVRTKIMHYSSTKPHSYRDDESSYTADIVAQLFSILCSQLGDNFMWVVVVKAQDLLLQYTKSAELPPPTFYFKIIQAINFVLHQLQEHCHQIVVPIIQSYPTKLTVCTERQRSVLLPLETKIAQGVQQSLDALLQHMGFLLRCDGMHIAHRNEIQQDKNDYAPKGDLVLSEATPCCLACVACIRQQFHEISKHLATSSVQLKLLWKELGIHLAAMLRAHVKKHRVNMSGALVLMRDIDTFRQAARCFESSAADKAFVELHTLASVFMVGQDHLPSLMQDHAHVEDLIEFVQMRSDYSEMKKNPRVV